MNAKKSPISVGGCTQSPKSIEIKNKITMCCYFTHVRMISKEDKR